MMLITTLVVSFLVCCRLEVGGTKGHLFCSNMKPAFPKKIVPSSSKAYSPRNLGPYKRMLNSANIGHLES